MRYYEGGSGQPLVFLHGAGGLDMDLGFLDRWPQKFHVYAPLVPGYGDSEECPELRDMLDFTLHTWDVVDRLGIKDPILAGLSMGGMIASEMAAIAPNDVSRLALIALGGPVAGRASHSRHFRHDAVSSCPAICSTTPKRARRS